MPIDVKVPDAGESIREVELGAWKKRKGDRVQRDEVLVEIETEKATLEVPAPVSGTLVEILKGEGDEAAPGDVIARIEEGEGGGDEDADGSEEASEERAAPEDESSTDGDEGDADEGEDEEGGDGESEADDESEGDATNAAGKAAAGSAGTRRVTPSARRLLREYDVDVADVADTEGNDRTDKQDVLRYLEATGAKGAGGEPAHRATQRIRMSPMRRTIARRLVEAQQKAALLTTFNEIDMGAVIGLRETYGEAFREKHGVKLGFMSFFVKAAVEAVRDHPALNARVDGEEIVYHDYQDVGIAVGGGKGLVVPVLRSAELLGFAEIERKIADLAERAQQNRLDLEELEGGTFTISNGGIYGSLLSTPIVNPPQSGVLGLHKIEKRPVVRGDDDEVVVRPMMYVALTYDHRVADGREAVQCLARIKEIIETPSRLMLEI